MTTKTITGDYSAGFSLPTSYSGLDITTTARVLGSGVQLHAFGTVANSGSVDALSTINGIGLYLNQEGILTNAYGADIEGVYGVRTGGYNSSAMPSTISNSGVIYGQRIGLQANYGVLITNTGVLSGYAVAALRASGAATVINMGQIDTLGPAANATAVDLLAGGTVTNGSTTDTSATILGNYGLYSNASSAATLTNFGTIDGTGGVAVEFKNAADRLIVESTATFSGAVVGGGGTLELAGGSKTITGLGGAGVMTGGGSAGLSGFGSYIVDAGAALTLTGADTLAATSQPLTVAGSLINTGTLTGPSGYAPGVFLTAGGSLTNGSATNHSALITGAYGVVAEGSATITNFGTIAGSGGAALTFAGPAILLRADSGSTILGLVDDRQPGGVIDVVSGVASFKGGLTTGGKVEGAGTLALTGGAITFELGTSLTVAEVTVAGASTAVNVATNLAYARIWTQSAGTVSVDPNDRLVFSGKGDGFAGEVTGTGGLVFSSGSDTFGGLTLSAKSQSIRNASVTLSGAVTLGTTLSVTTPNLIVAVGGATLSGAGAFILSNTATNSLKGASAAATLTDNGKILGAGSLGGGVMKLVIGAGGYVDGDDALSLTIDTGTNTIANAGIIYAVGAGGTIVDSAVANTGKLYAHGGVLTLNGAVTGVGQGFINGGTLDAASTFTENVTFNGPKGELELAHSQAYTGTITGFSLTGATSLDLRDISFISGKTKATYSGTTTAGTLTITDGTHTTRIKLTGNYTASKWILSAAAGGGTLVIDPTAPAAPPINPLPPHAFVAAMAAMDGGSGPVAVTFEAPSLHHTALVAPKGRIA